MIAKPKLYITRDKNGMFLWFSAVKPIQKGRCFENRCAASKTRLPLSWFGDKLNEGECREIEIDDLMNLPKG